ncbi:MULTISPECIES: DUF3800 domain-containing protein [Micrococcaceae]|uniref:DUF3800 domain-containing protein n=1 Tax=Pseudoglutamicibacter albus DNF00011 TaxID=1401063 RepID=A0A096AGF9_9MICC|nr:MULTISPECIES: DUF3800 domain-containing protein [Micrococcaceae]KGF20034.1 hypothetical protein HMPREF2128_07030 [Pseudoglutamicibacter albus DNF00011]OFT22489.1 hypothetical protein HMPREF3175_08315 [Arthrobacter sp. HMSC08H08]OFT40938.1 hypothetical protein HMPREF3160_08925 [Arthrobacter sp. HMSC06H05]
MDVNIYCDESTHLENDQMPYLVLGAVSCPQAKTPEVLSRLHEIRKKHGLSHEFETKWTKVSPSKIDYYLDLIDYFFDDDDLSFRAIVADKKGLAHGRFSQDHDTWYYKMLFLLFKPLIPGGLGTVNIYLDKKDTRSGEKVRELHNVIANSNYDFNKKKVRRVQILESHHVGLLQLADLLIGAVNYANRGLTSSSAKLQLVERIRSRSQKTLTEKTLPSEKKVNIFQWTPQEVQ